MVKLTVLKKKGGGIIKVSFCVKVRIVFRPLLKNYMNDRTKERNERARGITQ